MFTYTYHMQFNYISWIQLLLIIFIRIMFIDISISIYVTYQCNIIKKKNIDEWSFRAALVICIHCTAQPCSFYPSNSHPMILQTTIRPRESGKLKFVIALKPTLSLVYFPKPSGFQSKAFEGGFWPGTTVHGYSWTGALAVWRGSPGHTASRMRSSLDQFSRLHTDRTVLPGASAHTRSHICLVLLMNMHEQELRFMATSHYGQRMHTHAALCYLVLRPFIHTLEVSPPKNQSPVIYHHLLAFMLWQGVLYIWSCTAEPTIALW